MDNLRVSLIQGATIWHDPKANCEMYGAMMDDLGGKTDLIVLPETFTSGFSNEAIANAEKMEGPSLVWMREQAVKLGAVVTGSMQIREGNNVYNRLLWVTPSGELQYYDKRHLFRMAKEHERYASGRHRLTMELKGWRVCPLVCYDLRFPVFVRNRFNIEVIGRFDYDLLLFVANWPSARRYAWRSLLRARAIENLCCVAAVNRVGCDGNGLDYSGDSVALNHLGQTIIECGSKPQVVTVTFDAIALAMHRAQFPAQLDADNFELEI